MQDRYRMLLFYNKHIIKFLDSKMNFINVIWLKFLSNLSRFNDIYVCWYFLSFEKYSIFLIFIEIFLNLFTIIIFLKHYIFNIFFNLEVLNLEKKSCIFQWIPARKDALFWCWKGCDPGKSDLMINFLMKLENNIDFNLKKCWKWKEICDNQRISICCFRSLQIAYILFRNLKRI